jgi:hypothetical protein
MAENMERMRTSIYSGFLFFKKGIFAKITLPI